MHPTPPATRPPPPHTHFHCSLHGTLHPLLWHLPLTPHPTHFPFAHTTTCLFNALPPSGGIYASCKRNSLCSQPLPRQLRQGTSPSSQHSPFFSGYWVLLAFWGQALLRRRFALALCVCQHAFAANGSVVGFAFSWASPFWHDFKFDMAQNATAMYLKIPVPGALATHTLPARPATTPEHLYHL